MMSSDSWMDLLALMNLALGVVGFSWLSIRTLIRWGEYPTEVRKLKVLAIGLFSGLLMASGEIYFKHAAEQLVATVVIVAAVKLTALYVIWATQATKYRTGARYLVTDEGPNQDSTNPNEDI